ncbi:MAG TPA: DinB family protein [Candidatus Saccharimonadales bacterium]|nr:DinB family protein [Candidatus Saccharimonadales bacterium]
MKELLLGVSLEQARAHPIAGSHSIWELVLHIGVWNEVALDAIHGVPVPRVLPAERDWMAVPASAEAWPRDVHGLLEANRKLCNAIGNLGDERLGEIVAGRKYDFYTLLHGIVQHALYHAGQIALLRKSF